MTQEPSGGSRGCSCLGCSGCIVVFLGCILFGIFGLSLATAAPSVNPSPLIQVSGVVTRALLGSAPPSTRPPTTLATPDSLEIASPAEASYLSVFDWDRSWMNQSEQRLRYLSFFFSWWSSRWKSQLAAEAQGWRQLSAEVQQLKPPQEDQPLQARFVRAFQEYAVAADDIDRFRRSGDQQALDQGQDALQRGDDYIAEAQQVRLGGSSAIGPVGTNKALIGGLLTDDNLPPGWMVTSTPEDYADFGPSSPCDESALFADDQIIDGSAVLYDQTKNKNIGLQETIAFVGDSSAERGMRDASASFPCEPWTDDDGYSYHVTRLDVPTIGDDTVAYRVADLDEDGHIDTISNVFLVRQGGLVIEIWHWETGKAPNVDDTEAMARAAAARATSIPQDQEPSDPGGHIQADARLRLPPEPDWTGD